MSAFVHTAEHIDLLVSYAIRDTVASSSIKIFTTRAGEPTLWECTGFHAPEPIPSTKWNVRHEWIDADELGKLLLRQNVRSVLYRYSDLPSDEMGEYADTINGYRWEPVMLDEISNVEAVVIMACRSFAYQSCESLDYEQTDAHRWVEAIYHAAADAIADSEGCGWTFTREAFGLLKRRPRR